MVKPISLRLRADEVTDVARDILRRLDEDDRQRRSVRSMALKASFWVAKMDTTALAILKSPIHRERWQADLKTIQTILSRRIGTRGV